MTSLDLNERKRERDRYVQPDEEDRPRRRRSPVSDLEEVHVAIPSKLVELANVVYKLGLPAVLVLWLVWFITSGLGNDVKAMNQDHAAIKEALSGMREQQRGSNNFLRAICYKLPAQKGATYDPCDIYSPDGNK